MIGLGKRLLLLTGAATALALGVVVLSSGFVEIRIGEPWNSGVITGLVLLISSFVVAVWYESGDRRSDS